MVPRGTNSSIWSFRSCQILYLVHLVTPQSTNMCIWSSWRIQNTINSVLVHLVAHERSNFGICILFLCTSVAPKRTHSCMWSTTLCNSLNEWLQRGLTPVFDENLRIIKIRCTIYCVFSTLMGSYLHLKFFEDPEFWIKYSWGFQREQIPLFEAHLGFRSYLIMYLVHLVAPERTIICIWSS